MLIMPIRSGSGAGSSAFFRWPLVLLWWLLLPASIGAGSGGPVQEFSSKQVQGPEAGQLLGLGARVASSGAPPSDRLRLAPPMRALPSDTIVLEGGATTVTQITSLEEYLEHLEQHEEELRRRAKEETGTLEQQLPPASKRRTATETSSATSNDDQSRHHPLPPVNQTTTNTKPIPQHWQVRSLLNFTHDYPLAHSRIIYGYVWPLVAGITLFTNLMIVFVLTQRDMRTPTNIVLSAIAIADIIPITGPVPWFIYLFAMGNEKQVLYPPMACYFYQHSTRSISEIFYFLSTWLNLLLAALDYMAACWPELTKKYFRNRVVVLEIIVMSLLALLLNLPQALKVVFKPVKFYYRGELTWGCRALQAKWFKDLVGEYVALYDDIFTAIIVVFVDGGPALGLIILTALLIKQLKRQRIRGHILMEQARTASKRRRERHRQQEIESSARVMIFVLLAFLAVKIPFATTYTLMIIQSRFDIHFVENLVDFQKAITITDLVFVLSYPINFTIFCCCSKKFRHKCGQLLSECSNNNNNRNNNRNSMLAGRFMRSISGSLDSSFSARGGGGGGNNSRAMSADKRRTLESLASEDLKWWANSGERSVRHQSTVSEVSWAGLVPQPAQLKLEQYEQQLPRILTTECGSIAPSEDALPAPDMNEKPRAEGDVTEIERAVHSSASGPASSSSSSSGNKTTTMEPHEDSASNNNNNRQQDEDDELAGGESRASSALLAKAGVGQSPALVSIRRLASHFGARYLSNDNLQVGGSGGAASTASQQSASTSLGPHDERAADKRRALSLSNSRLYNLPSSTGQLANVLLKSLEEPLSEGAKGGLRIAFGLSNNNNNNRR